MSNLAASSSSDSQIPRNNNEDMSLVSAVVATALMSFQC